MIIFCLKSVLAKTIKIIIRTSKLLCILNYACLLIYCFLIGYNSGSITDALEIDGRFEFV